MTKRLQDVYAIILAAGASRRFGSPKQLADWQDRTLIQHAVQVAQSVFGNHVIVMIGAHLDRVEAALMRYTVKVVLNSQWSEGIAASIRAGIKAVPGTARAAMVMLCDQPLVTSASLQQLTDTWQQHPDTIVASEYDGTRGAPALFPAASFSDLMKLEGDRGAKHLLNNPQSNVRTVCLPEAATDIDTTEDFEQLLALARS